MVHDLVGTFPRGGGTKDDPTGPCKGRRTTKANSRHSSSPIRGTCGFVVGQRNKFEMVKQKQHRDRLRGAEKRRLIKQVMAAGRHAGVLWDGQIMLPTSEQQIVAQEAANSSLAGLEHTARWLWPQPHCRKSERRDQSRLAQIQAWVGSGP
jgi:hypothetical protein